VSQQFSVLYGYWAVHYVRMATREQPKLAGHIRALTGATLPGATMRSAPDVRATHQMIDQLLTAHEHLEHAVTL
jgi:hypothetical protein